MFAYPSLAEGFGLPLLEALACGLPVVASELPALRETAASHAHFVAPDRVDAIADAIIRVHESPADPSAVEQRRMRARRYDWAVCANKTLAIYEEVRR
jgi:glycosyltransferase involved in cell wall biosynthesis